MTGRFSIPGWVLAAAHVLKLESWAGPLQLLLPWFLDQRESDHLPETSRGPQSPSGKKRRGFNVKGSSVSKGAGQDMAWPSRTEETPLVKGRRGPRQGGLRAVWTTRTEASSS